MLEAVSCLGADVGAEDELEEAQLLNVGKVVLLAEDDPLTRLVTAEFLREANLTVVEATSGDEAWQYVEAGGKPDLVFTDIQMPGQIDGRGLVELVTQTLPEAKIVVVSGNPGPSPGVEFSNFLRKPYSFDYAIELVRKLLGIEDSGNSNDPSRSDGNPS